MGSYLNNTYLIKALAAYPWDLDETVENLNYALSYDPHDARALLLKGTVCLRNFRDYPEAIDYLTEALANDMDLIDAYPLLAEAYCASGRYTEGIKLIEFGLTIPGAHLGQLYYIAARILECGNSLKLCRDMLDVAREHAMNAELRQAIDESRSRVKSKQKRLSKRRKKLNRQRR